MKTLIALVLASACALATGAAQAGNVYWSVGINVPPVGSVISSAPAVVVPAPVVVPAAVYVAPAPVYVAPPPLYVAPPPMYFAPPPVFYRPAPVVVRPVPVVAYPEHRHRGWRRGEWRGDRHDERGTGYPDGRWADERRFRHDR